MPRAPGLTKLEQGKILAYSSVSMPIWDIAKAVGHSKSVVHAFLKNPEDCGTKKSPGRPRLLKTHDRTRLRRHAASGEYTANELHQELNIDASVRTVQRELQRCDYLSFEKTNKSPCMTTYHKTMRAVWVERQIRLRTDWSRVVLTDEKKFNLDGPDGCKHCWHDLRNDKKITWSRHSGGGSVMVWGGMSSLGKIRLAFLKGNQDAFDYQQALITHLFEFVDGVHEGDYVFQHDNASIHQARAAKDSLADLNISTIGWPSLSPDLNPIKNLWGIMARRVYKNARQYLSADDLKTAILAVWDEISVDLLVKLTRSMYARFLAVVRGKGNKIAYWGTLLNL